jgi:serine/threonine protein phosphatase 1
VEVAGNKYFLSHTIPGKEEIMKFSHCKMEDFLWGEPEYDKEYYPDKVFVTGHTPTGLIDPAYKGKIFKSNNHIAIDCGAVFGNPLGCIRLDDLQEFYV